MKIDLNRRPAGFSLVEMLVSMVIVGVALMALAHFTGSLSGAGSEAKARSLAAALAQEKLEDLRSFVSSTAFQQIGNNAGGELASWGTPVAVADSNVEFTRQWTLLSIQGTEPNNTKVVRVTVGWAGPDLDENGQAKQHSLSLIGEISSRGITSSAIAAGGQSRLAGPTSRYSPKAAPDVIAIPLDLDLGDGLTKESTTPEPTVIAQAGTTETYFDEVIYDNALRDATGSPVVRRDEFLTLNCICVQEGTGQGLGPFVIEPLEDVFKLRDANGDDIIDDQDMVTKRAGRAASSNESVTEPDGSTRNLNLAKQPEKCNACCRDHHDGGGATDQFDPFRIHPATSADGVTLSGDHEHFFPDADGTLQPANAVDDLYLEACRFVRVDGFLRVTQDWRLESLQVLVKDELKSVISGTTTVDSAGLAAYKAYVTQFVRDYVTTVVDNSNDGDSSNDYPTHTPSYYPQTSSVPADPDFSSDFYTKLAALRNRISEDPGDQYVLSSSASLAQRELSARAIYMDYMDQALIDTLECKMSSITIAGCQADEVNDPAFLAFVPFHEVNLNKLANWYWEGNTFTITSEPIADIYSRGVLENLSTGCDDALSNLERSNTGLTDTRTIDNVAQANAAEDTAFLTDGITAQVNGGSCAGGVTPPVAVGGSLALGNDVQLGGESDVVITVGGVDCVKQQEGQGVNTQWVWSCPLDDSGNGTIRVSGYNAIYVEKLTGQDKQCSPNNEVVMAGVGVPPLMVQNDGTVDEVTEVEYSGAASDQVVDITIQQQTLPSCQNI